LIANWKSGWKYVSVQLAALLAIGSQAFEMLPIIQQYMPPNVVTYIAIAIIIARLVSQPKRVAEEKEAKDVASVEIKTN